MLLVDKGDKHRGMCLSVVPNEDSYGTFASILWLAQVTPSLLPLIFQIKGLG